MRVGSFAHFGRSYRIHAHVMESGSAEGAGSYTLSRSAASGTSICGAAYEAEKRAILRAALPGATNTPEAKGEFIRRVLGNRPKRL